MDTSLGLLGGIDGGGGLPSNDGDSSDHNLSSEVSSSYDHDLELGLGLSIGCGSNTNEEASNRVLNTKNSPFFISSLISSCSSSSSANSSIAGTKRAAINSVAPPNATSVVGWPPIRRAHRMPILANRIKSDRKEYSSRAENKNKKANGYQSVKVNMDGTLIGRKVDLNAHSAYDMLAQTLEDMFYDRLWSTKTVGRSRLLSGTSDFVLTYEDRDGDCMLVGDVPWPMFLSSVKRLRILRNPKSSGPDEQLF